LTPQRRASTDRGRRRAAGVRAAALALAAVVFALACAPAVGAHAGAASAVLDRGGTQGPGRPGDDGPDADAPDADAPDDDDLPRPVATRPPGAGAPAPGAAAAEALAVRGLRVPAHVGLATARGAGIAASFVPRPGSLVAEVRLSAGGRLVARRLIAVRAGRRVIAHVHAGALPRGAYEVSVRAGAGRATLGPAVAARVRVG
jgi:hypothetical protein